MIDNEVQIIAGRPSTGKTLMASQICRDSIKLNQTTLYFSIELSKSYLSQNYAIPKEVKIIDNPDLTWVKIKRAIVSLKPYISIIDYIQLIKNNNPQLINKIIREYYDLPINGKLYILSQFNRTGIRNENPIHFELHKAKLSYHPTKVYLTFLHKTIYKL